jgi:signal transduction histidine kinase
VRRRGLRRYLQRYLWGLIALFLALTAGSATIGAFRLHEAVLDQRQTVRTQELSQAALMLGEVPATSRAALDAAFASVASHNGAEGARLRAAYMAFRNAPGDRTALNRLETKITTENESLAAEIRAIGPSARWGLILACITAGISVLLLITQFELERRAGRIDRDYAEKADELIRLRDDFVAVVSHELRTPLTSIIGYLELILDDDPGRMSEEQQAYFKVVERSTRRLIDLVGDLLVVAEADRGVLALDLGDVDLAALAQHSVEAALPVADANEVGLTLVGSESGTVRGDPKRLAQMLDNLVSNALKFSPPGGHVTVSAGRDVGGAVFEVTDTGDGIAEADRLHLFEPFFRSRSVQARSVPGTGLGLTITKAIVDAHHGSIEVRSAPGAGTTFRVLIPA